eukprot:7126129-Pyramimonas_sp.AAC.2
MKQLLIVRSATIWGLAEGARKPQRKGGGSKRDLLGAPRPAMAGLWRYLERVLALRLRKYSLN